MFKTNTTSLHLNTSQLVHKRVPLPPVPPTTQRSVRTATGIIGDGGVWTQIQGRKLFQYELGMWI